MFVVDLVKSRAALEFVYIEPNKIEAMPIIAEVNTGKVNRPIIVARAPTV